MTCLLQCEADGDDVMNDDDDDEDAIMDDDETRLSSDLSVTDVALQDLVTTDDHLDDTYYFSDQLRGVCCLCS